MSPDNEFQLSSYDIGSDLLQKVPLTIIERYQVMPIRVEDDKPGG